MTSSGLEGIIAGSSSISQVDPKGDKLIYRGYDVRELAEKCSYEETAHLILMGSLPNAGQLADFSSQLTAAREIPKEMNALFSEMDTRASVMDRLRTAVSCLGLFDPDNGNDSHDANMRKAVRLIAQMPALIAHCYYLPGRESVPKQNPKFSYAKNFLYMLTGQEKDDYSVQVFDASLTLYAEHGFNASTFAARVTIATQSDMYSAVTSAIGTLKGSLHGGANEKAMEMLLEVGTPEKAESWIRAALREKKKIMGFGHRVYKIQDSRAPILKKMLLEFAQKKRDLQWVQISESIERVMKEEKKLFPNVDFPCAVLYYELGLAIALYTPIFAAARMAGWCAHAIEQLDNNRLIRPECEYTGPTNLAYVPIEKR
ncbi:MAG: citrate synthase [Candidatus Omnitrophica bacterium]|nr:citrate synthase [Candidatus Omnitrophota bacterium]